MNNIDIEKILYKEFSHLEYNLDSYKHFEMSREKINDLYISLNCIQQKKFDDVYNHLTHFHRTYSNELIKFIINFYRSLFK